MAIALNAQTETTSSVAEASWAFNHTCSGSDRLLLVIVHLMRTTDGGIDVSTCTFGGTAMTLGRTRTWADTTRTRSYRTSIYYLINPGTSEAEVAVTSSANSQATVIKAVSLTGVHQTTPTGGNQGVDINNSTSATVTVTATTANAWLVGAALMRGGDLTYTPGTDVTEWYDLASGTDSTTDISTTAGYKLVSGAGSLTVNFTASSADYGVITGLEILPTAASSISGTASITLDGLTTSATGTLAIKGTLASTLDGVTLSSAGALAIKGTSAVTLDGLSLSSTGTVAITGTASVTLDGLTLSSSGVLPIVGTASITFDGLTLETSGGFGTQTAGELDVTLDGLTLTATGVLPITGVAGVTLDDMTLAATGTLPIVGVLGVTLEDLALAATGTLAAPESRTGELAVTLDGLTLTSSAVLPITGVAAITLSGLTLVAAGGAPLAPVTVALAIGLIWSNTVAVSTVYDVDLLFEPD